MLMQASQIVGKIYEILLATILVCLFGWHCPVKWFLKADNCQRDLIKWYEFYHQGDTEKKDSVYACLPSLSRSPDYQNQLLGHLKHW